MKLKINLLKILQIGFLSLVFCFLGLMVTKSSSASTCTDQGCSAPSQTVNWSSPGFGVVLTLNGGIAGAKNTNSTSATFSGLLPSTSYNYVVCAPNCGTGKTIKSGSKTSTSGGSLTVSWQYTVVLWTTPGCASCGSKSGTTTGTSITFNDLEPSHVYSDTVCTDNCGSGYLVKNETLPATGACTNCPNLGTPTPTSPINNQTTNGSPTFTWTAATGTVDHYGLWLRKDNALFGSGLFATNVSGSSTSKGWNDGSGSWWAQPNTYGNPSQPLTNGTYFWRVLACGDAACSIIHYSTDASFTVSGGGGSIAATVSGSTVTFNWDAQPLAGKIVVWPSSSPSACTNVNSADTAYVSGLIQTSDQGVLIWNNAPGGTYIATFADLAGLPVGCTAPFTVSGTIDRTPITAEVSGSTVTFHWGGQPNEGIIFVWPYSTDSACTNVNADTVHISPRLPINTNSYPWPNAPDGTYRAAFFQYIAGDNFPVGCVSFTVGKIPEAGPGGLTGIIDVLALGGKISTPADFISAVYKIILLIAGFILVIFIIISGLQIIFSQGDPKALSSARGRLTFAIVGFVIIFGAFVITIVFQKIFGLKIF